MHLDVLGESWPCTASLGGSFTPYGTQRCGPDLLEVLSEYNANSMD